jgi:GNAT superfamily N-acetyltransferase
MAVSFSLVNGAGFASEASRILEDAWEPPTLRYSPGYLGWQLTFPSEVELPAVAATEGGEPVGLAAATDRRLRCGSSAFGVAVVSFVAVRPAWRNRGVASGLYRLLLKALADLSVPVITFGIPGSGGTKRSCAPTRKLDFKCRRSVATTITLSSRGQKRRTEIGQTIFPKRSEPFLRWRPSLRVGIRMFFGAHRRVSKGTTISGIRVLESSSSWMVPLVGYAAQV